MRDTLRPYLRESAKSADRPCPIAAAAIVAAGSHTQTISLSSTCPPHLLNMAPTPIGATTISLQDRKRKH